MSGPCGHEAHEHGHGHGHGGHHNCNHTNDDKESETVIAGDSLLQYVDLPRVRGLNISEPDELPKVFKTYDRRRDTSEFIESDADEELLIYIPFTDVVKIKGLTIVGGTDTDDSSAPAQARLFINRADLDFDSAADTQAVQEIDLQKDSLGDMEYPLKTSKFTAVRDLTIYITGNFGADLTRINMIHFRGASTKISTDRVVMHAVYEATGQLSDHDVRDQMKGAHAAM